MKPRRLLLSAVTVALALLSGTALSAADPDTAGEDPMSRVPWTTSRLRGTPEPPPPYAVESAFPQLRFRRPVVLTNAPGTERLFVAEQHGRIYSFPNDHDCIAPDLVIDLTESHAKLTAIYGLTFHPRFERNRFVYVCYTLENNRPDGTRVARFNVTATDPPQIDPHSERVILTWLSGGHNGGCLKFGHDGFLYISTGDGAGPSPPDPLRAGQDVSNLLSAILRIDVDASDAGRAYRVPSDNPLLDVPDARPEIWAYGFRNPWKMSFDRTTGALWVGDVGWDQWEMIYRVQQGGNYGWSVMEGRQPVLPEEPRGPTPILRPTVDHPHSEAASITGGFVYRGGRLDELKGAYIYGDYQTGKVWGLRMEGEKVAWQQELAATPLQLVAFGEDHAGELFLVDHDRTGQIYRLIANPASGGSQPFPIRLSETGLFASVAGETPARGVIEYSINAPHWADGAQSRRWLAVPGDERIEIDEKGRWDFPDGSVLAKTVSIELNPVDPTSRRRLETQILHREEGSWRPYTYAWPDDANQTDAVLVEAHGFDRTLVFRDEEAPGRRREQTYRFASRAECLLCHNPWVEQKTTVFGVQSASPLAVDVLQLNRSRDDGGHTTNQLRMLARIGLLGGRVVQAERDLPRLTNPCDESADLTARARSYLHVNCAHCHQFNAGGTATILLSHDVPLGRTKMLNERPTQGTFGVSDARIVAPGDPFGSVLYYRIAKLGAGRMPRVGSRCVDETAVRLFYDWIAQLDNPSPSQQAALQEIRQPSLARPAGSGRRLGRAVSEVDAEALADVHESDSADVRAAAIGRLCASTRGALALLRMTDVGDVNPQTRREIIDLAKDHPDGEIRDLFERFVPESDRVQRLGAVVNQAEVLNLQADAERGKQIFFNESAASCKSCHRVEGQGEALGPDLSQIGKKYGRDELLAQILDPSRIMEPKYVPYLLETTRGRVFTGLLEEKTPESVTLRDARNQRLSVAANEVELLVPQRKSLMPELLLRDMTRQQVADLLAYLATLK